MTTTTTITIHVDHLHSLRLLRFHNMMTQSWPITCTIQTMIIQQDLTLHTILRRRRLQWDRRDRNERCNHISLRHLNTDHQEHHNCQDQAQDQMTGLIPVFLHLLMSHDRVDLDKVDHLLYHNHLCKSKQSLHLDDELNANLRFRLLFELHIHLLR